MKVDLTDTQLNEIQRNVSKETWESIHDKILAASVPKGRSVTVQIRMPGDKSMIVTGQRLSDAWSITPMIANDKTIHKSKKSLTHNSSGLSVMIGCSKREILTAWAKLSRNAKAEIETPSTIDVGNCTEFKDVIHRAEYGY